MSFREDELLPLSGLQHVVYCERQAALIHVEQVWVENVWTIEGRQIHEKVTSGDRESRVDIRIARDVPMRSLELGITGRADVVEFHRVDDGGQGVPLPRDPGLWRPFPVEYKRGRKKVHREAEVQLCAQAICLEEMFSITIEKGALFYGKVRRRSNVRFDQGLRARTEEAASRFRQLLTTGLTPAMSYEAVRCDECSLLDICRPKAIGRDARRYLKKMLVVDFED